MNRNVLSRIIQLGLVVVIFVTVLIIAVRYQTVSVPVLNTPAKAGDIVQSSQISYVSLPASAVFPDLLTNAQQVQGQQASVNIDANAPLKSDEFVPAGTKRAPKLDSDFPYAASEDLPKIRYALPTDLLHSSGGLLSVGDYVNIQERTTDNGASSAKFILQKVHIIGAEDAQGNSLSFVPAAPADAPKSSTIAYWFIALTQSQADEFGAIPWQSLYLFKTDLTKPLLTYGGQTVEIASFGNSTPTSQETPTPTPASGPTAAPTLVPFDNGTPTPSVSATPSARSSASGPPLPTPTAS
jgi:hypothetical protein